MEIKNSSKESAALRIREIIPEKKVPRTQVFKHRTQVFQLSEECQGL